MSDDNISYNTDDSLVTPQTAISGTSSEDSGLIGFLINRGLAKNKREANRILLIVIVLVIGAIVWVNWGRLFPAAPPPPPSVTPGASGTPTP